MMRAIGILAMDVLVFMVLFVVGAVVQGALPWPAFVIPFLFLPAFLYGAYRHPDLRRGEMRVLLWMTISVSVAIGVVFDLLRFPVGSSIATLLMIGITSITSRCLSFSSPPR